MAKIALGGNLFDGVPEMLAEELIETVARSAHVRIERIVSRGHRSAPDYWYDQETVEFVVLLRGSAGIRTDAGGDVIVMHPGDTLAIPAHARHQVAWTDPDQDTVWLAVHYDA